MKKKSILGTVLSLGLAGLMMTACSTANAATLETQLTNGTPSAVTTVNAQSNIMPLAATQENTEVITHIQRPTSLLDELVSQSDDVQIAFWDNLRQNYPDVYTIEFYDEDGVIVTALVIESPDQAAAPVIINNLDEALALHKVDNLAMPSWLPEGFAFEHAWYPYSFCPISNPDSDNPGLQLFVVFSDGEQNLTLEMRYHPEHGGFDGWSNLSEITINGRNAVIGDGTLSVQVTHNARYTFMTESFAGAAGSTISHIELIKIAESISSEISQKTGLQRDVIVRMDYNSFYEWMNQRLAAYAASGNYSADVLAMFHADYLRDLEGIRNGYHMYLFEDADGNGTWRVLHNPADGEFSFRIIADDEGDFLEINHSDDNPFWSIPLN